jgi:hypothetical protein
MLVMDSIFVSSSDMSAMVASAYEQGLVDYHFGELGRFKFSCIAKTAALAVRCLDGGTLADIAIPNADDKTLDKLVALASDAAEKELARRKSGGVSDAGIRISLRSFRVLVEAAFWGSYPGSPSEDVIIAIANKTPEILGKAERKRLAGSIRKLTSCDSLGNAAIESISSPGVKEKWLEAAESLEPKKSEKKASV